jgi:hypothetical protein
MEAAAGVLHRGRPSWGKEAAMRVMEVAAFAKD